MVALKNKGAAFGAVVIVGIACAVGAQGALLANFQASSYNATANTLTDSVSNIVATGTGANSYNPTTGSVAIGGGFTFNASTALPSLVGTTNYTIAVGFTYNGGANGGGVAYQGQGVLGGDIPGTGTGDANIGVTSSNSGQILGTNGAQTTAAPPTAADYSVVDENITNATNGRTGIPYNFVPGSATGAVLVVTSTGSDLYVNGAHVDTASFTPTGFSKYFNGTNDTGYTFGIGANAGDSGSLNGDITQAQIYSTSLDATEAEALSLTIGTPSVVPEPTSFAVLGMGAVVLLASRRRRRLV